MIQILSKYSTTISELKKQPSALIKEANGEPIAILNHNKPTAYIVPSELYAKMLDIIDEYYLKQEVEERLNYGKDDLVEVSLNEL